MIIIVDSRETRPFAFDCPCIVQKLPEGDYTIQGFESKIIVERKSLTDLYSSLLTKRFAAVLTRMATYPYPFLVIDAGWHDIQIKNDYQLRAKCKIPPTAITGKLCNLMTKTNIRVIAVDKGQAAKFVYRLFEYMYPRLKKGEL